jgi:hypothetical protein
MEAALLGARDELVTYCRRDDPGRELIQRVPPLPRPKSSDAAQKSLDTRVVRAVRRAE